MFRIPVISRYLALSIAAWGVTACICVLAGFSLAQKFGMSRLATTPQMLSPDPLVAAETAANRHLMGQANGKEASLQDQSTDRYLLLATVTASAGQPGWAVIAVDGGGQSAIIEGQEITSGAKLVRVSADHIEIQQGKVNKLVNLSPPNSSADDTREPIQDAPGQSNPAAGAAGSAHESGKTNDPSERDPGR